MVVGWRKIILWARGESNCIFMFPVRINREYFNNLFLFFCLNCLLLLLPLLSSSSLYPCFFCPEVFSWLLAARLEWNSFLSLFSIEFNWKKRNLYAKVARSGFLSIPHSNS